MKLHYYGYILLLTALIVIGGCEGPEGPRGEGGHPGAGGVGYTYRGDSENSCDPCHRSVVNTWLATGHSEAYHSLEAGGNERNLYCVQCHSTGFDAEVSYGDSLVQVLGPDLYGFDDYWPPQTGEDSSRIEALMDVHCEACHGPLGPTIYDKNAVVTFATRLIEGGESSMCVKCHSQVEEWHHSGHGSVLETHDMTIAEFNAEFNAFSTCWECHTGEGFASVYDSYWGVVGRPTTANLIGCPSCHDAMANSNQYQLRTLDSYSVMYDAAYPAVFAGYGSAQLCVQCHHALRNVDNVETQIEYGANHFGPHGSPQMDMFLGTGCYELSGYSYDRNHQHQSAETACVTCHMEMRSHSDSLGWKGGHDFIPTAATCLTGGCHSAMPEDFDLNNAASRIDSLLERLITLIGVEPDDLGDPGITSVEQRRAGYAYKFAASDGSRGMHNPAYAESLLENAISYMEAVNAKWGGGRGGR